MTRLAGKTVWITGASSGIGEALAVTAAGLGARLVLSARREAELRRVQSRCPDPAQVAVLPLDLLQMDPAAAAQAAGAFFGPVDVLVNNAGRSHRGLVADTAIPVYRTLMELDFIAPVALTQAVLPQMRGRGGHVVMIGSVISRVATPKRSGYAAAKHALAGFTEAARAELWADGIRFTFVMPGFVRTNVSLNALQGDGTVNGRMDAVIANGMDPMRCAAAIWKAVERDRAELLIAGPEGLAILAWKLLPGLYRWGVRRLKV